MPFGRREAILEYVFSARHALIGVIPLVLACMPCSTAAQESERAVPSAVVSIPPIGWTVEGTYRLNGGAAELLVRRVKGDILELVSSQGWDGVGLLDGKIFRGVFRYRESAGSKKGLMGVHTIDWRALDAPVVYATLIGGTDASAPERWNRSSSLETPPDAPSHIPPPPSGPYVEPRAGSGYYMDIDQLPVAVTKVAPVYPDIAREAGIDGLVIVQVWVREDGTVGDARVNRSVPMLDASAIKSVRQYRFKPAVSRGRAIGVWFPVPVRFTLH